jgi:hypothetical protein
MPTAPRILEHVRYLPRHISAGLGGDGDFVEILTPGGRFHGICAFDADPTNDHFDLSIEPFRANWYAPMSIAKIAYSEILEIRCGARSWVPAKS